MARMMTHLTLGGVRRREILFALCMQCCWVSIYAILLGFNESHAVGFRFPNQDICEKIVSQGSSQFLCTCGVRQLDLGLISNPASWLQSIQRTDQWLPHHRFCIEHSPGSLSHTSGLQVLQHLIISLFSCPAHIYPCTYASAARS